MLQFADSPYRYTPPKPNRLGAWFGGWWNARYHLPGPLHLIRSVELENGSEVKEAYRRQGQHVLFLPNHSTHSDPQIIMETMRQLGARSLCMAAYDIFQRDALVAWVMRRLGAFSVDRDGNDKQSLKQAIKTLV